MFLPSHTVVLRDLCLQPRAGSPMEALSCVAISSGGILSE